MRRRVGRTTAVTCVLVDITLLSLVDSGAGCGRRTPVLNCADELKAGGAKVEHVEAADDAGIDEALEGEGRLVVAADNDAQVRAVLRRAVRRLAPPPSKRTPDVPGDRTVPDLPALGILPLAETPELVERLDLPVNPQEVAKAVLSGDVRRTDLLRHDGGGVTVHGVRLGGGDRPFRGRIALDDKIVSDGEDALVTCVVANIDGYGMIDGLPLCEPDPADGALDVAIAVPYTHGVLRRRTRIEVRRARGRAVAITPLDDVPYVDDGVAGELGRKRTWWMERGAAGWYSAPKFA